MLQEKRQQFPNKDTQYDRHIHRDVYEAIKNMEGEFTCNDAYAQIKALKKDYLTKDHVRRAVANICGVYGLGLRRVRRGVYTWAKP